MTMPIQPGGNDKQQAMVGLNHALLNAFHNLYLGKRRAIPPGLERLGGMQQRPGGGPGFLANEPGGLNIGGVRTETPITAPTGGFPSGKFPDQHEGIAGFWNRGEPPASGFPVGKFPTDTGGIAGFTDYPRRRPGGTVHINPYEGIAGFNNRGTQPIAPSFPEGKFPTDTGGIAGFGQRGFMGRRIPLTAVAARLMGRRG